MKNIKFINSPTERTTAITDALLALLALVAILLLWRFRLDAPWKVSLWITVLGLLALSAMLGAIAHGFKMSKKSNTLFWQPLNLILGLTLALFTAGVIYDGWGLSAAQRMLPVMVVMGLGFFAATRRFPDTFLVFIIYQSATMLFALNVYIWLGIQNTLNGAWFMVAAVLLAIMAGAVQGSKVIAFILIWEFDHNGVYHLLQMVGVILLTIGLLAGISTS